MAGLSKKAAINAIVRMARTDYEIALSLQPEGLAFASMMGRVGGYKSALFMLLSETSPLYLEVDGLVDDLRRREGAA